jgi:hypothetical protein
VLAVVIGTSVLVTGYRFVYSARPTSTNLHVVWANSGNRRPRNSALFENCVRLFVYFTLLLLRHPTSVGRFSQGFPWEYWWEAALGSLSRNLRL